MQLQRTAFISLLFCTSLIGCSIATKNRAPEKADSIPTADATVEGLQKSSADETATADETSKDFVPVTPSPVPNTAAEAAASNEPSPEVKIELKKISEMAEGKSSPKETLVKNAPVVKAAPGVTAETSLRWLKNGNIRFRKGSLRADGQSLKDVKKVAVQQKPHAIIIGCADSRMSPELLFDQKLGEIYVIRQECSVPVESFLPSVDYAVQNLPTQLVMVLTDDQGSHNSQSMAKELLEKSAPLKDKVASGELKVVSAIYRLNSGQVEISE